MKLPFVKIHGAGNDFLFTPESEAPGENLAEIARSLCDRHTGVGADGWYLVSRGSASCDAAITLYNSDGSQAGLSGNGTRCAAALLVDAGLVGEEVLIRTGTGIKRLRLLEREGRCFTFEMEMGRPVVANQHVRFNLPLTGGPQEVTILDVGNPQCAVFVNDLSFDWRRMGREIEKHPQFLQRTNVSFVRVVDEHTVEARFYERGAGETLSSGTGSTGAAIAAIIRGLAKSPVCVVTPAGKLSLRWDGDVFLVGPAEIVARGEYFLTGRTNDGSCGEH